MCKLFNSNKKKVYEVYKRFHGYDVRYHDVLIETLNNKNDAKILKTKIDKEGLTEYNTINFEGIIKQVNIKIS
jgi:hypothetical protein